jgi:hypothetical protein
MTNLAHPNSATHRITWLLYTDVNTRFNLMMDECAHLQQTINCYRKNTYPSTDVAENQMRNEDYYFKAPQERALENLWHSMDALKVGLVANQNQLRVAYRKTLKNFGGASDAMYWFLSLRGHFISIVFGIYLKQLQHAHEKIVQFLENMPGFLPGPTLLRRWSSAGYGEFLSEYSRTVNWETQNFLWKFCIYGENENSEIKLNKWREEQYLVHAWSHESTSFTRVIRASAPTPDLQTGARYTTIWSSYFYLEQPILFSLLYHECAHHFANKENIQIDKEDDRLLASHKKLWYERPKETAALLKRLVNLDIEEQGFWLTFVNEVWADTVSCALTGSGFLAALSLTLTGFQDPDSPAYSDYDINNDELIPLTEIGTSVRKALPIQYPHYSLSYFWEARLSLAVKVLGALYPESEAAWVKELELIMNEWHTSGSKAMSSSSVSREHEDQWKYRKKLNDWVTSVTWAHLKELVSAIAVFQRSQKSKNKLAFELKNTNSSANTGAEIIASAFECHLKQLFPSDTRISKSVENTKAQINRIENVCINIRWQLSEYIVPKLLADIDNEQTPIWIENFANYVRSDGSIAFRIGLEWSTTRRDVIRTAGWLLRQKYSEDQSSLQDLVRLKKEIPFRDQSFLTALESAVDADFQEYYSRSNLVPSEQKQKALGLSTALTQKQTLRDIGLKHFTGVNLHQFMIKFESDLEQALKIPTEEPTLGVGTFTLGVARPENLLNSAFNDYSAVIDKVQETYVQAFQEKLDLIEKIYTTGLTEQDTRFYRMIGEYSFAYFEPSFTPVEKDWRVEDTRALPKILAKPRAVIRVLKQNQDKHIDSNFFSRVSQIGFKFRWQWINLRKALIQKQIPCELYLSSAWEDVILITYHKDIEDYQYVMVSLDLVSKAWQDIHSSIALAQKPNFSLTSIKVISTQSADDSTIHPVVKQLRQLAMVKSIQKRTGRYDITVIWDTDKPENVWNALANLRKDFWQYISNNVTSLVVEEDQTKYYFVSQLILRHD